MSRIFIICIMLLGAATGLRAQGQVTAALDKSKILIGDQIKLTVNVKVDDPSHSSVKDILFAAIDTITGVEVVKELPLSQVNKTSGLWEKSITLTSFEAGNYTLSPAEVILSVNGTDKTLRSNSLGFTVETLEVDEKTALQPIKGLHEEPINFWDIFPYLIGLLVLASIFLGIRYFRNKEEIQEEEKIPEIILPPHEIALTKLADLDHKQLWQKGDIKTFQSELTFILREYLEGRYDVPALESTTYEIIRDLKDTDISEQQTNDLKRILETADLVKFAKSEPPIEINQQAFDAIKAFVLDTKKELTIETADEAEKND